MSGKNQDFGPLRWGCLITLCGQTRMVKLPVVFWEDHCPYTEPGKNGWELYFRPLSAEPFDYATEEPLLHRPYWDPDDQAVFTLLGTVIAGEFRDKCHAIFKKYLVVQPHITEIVDQFYIAHMAGVVTAGIHLRGTDKGSESLLPRPSDIIRAANEWASKQPGTVQFFIATDEEKLLDVAQRESHYPIICYDSYRSKDDKPIHGPWADCSPYKKGSDILIETLLLSRCNVLFHHDSNVTFAALFLNPYLEDHYIDRYKHVIGRPCWRMPNDQIEQAGFFYSLFSLVGHCFYAEQDKKSPVAFWEKDGANQFLRYFQSLSDATYEDGDQVCVYAHGPLLPQTPEQSADYQHRVTLPFTVLRDSEYRNHCHRIITKYLHLQPDFATEIDAFWDSNKSEEPDIITIGVHIPALSRRENIQLTTHDYLLGYAKYLANALKNKGKRCRFFIATNECNERGFGINLRGTAPVFWHAERRGESISTVCRSVNETSAADCDPDKDALLNAYCFAKCDYLVHTHSNLAYFALVLNPSLVSCLVPPYN